MRRDGHEGDVNSQGRGDAVMFGPDGDNGTKIPSQVETLIKGTAKVTAEYKPIPDLDYLQVPFSDHLYCFLVQFTFVPCSSSIYLKLTLLVANLQKLISHNLTFLAALTVNVT
jgi:hypothetical protein